jgi:hypothetical protein
MEQDGEVSVPAADRSGRTERLAPLQGQLASAASVTDEALIAAVGAVIGLYVLCGTALDVSAAAQRLGPQIDASAGDEAASPQALGSNERPNDAMDEDSGTSAARDDAPALEDDGGVQLWHLEVPAGESRVRASCVERC